LKFLSYPTFSGAVPENIEEHDRRRMRPRSNAGGKKMYSGTLIDQILASVERAEEHVQRDLDLRDAVLLFDDYSTYFQTVAPAMQKPAVA
jgi:hypothetical protein